jgi:hypothetical protein
MRIHIDLIPEEIQHEYNTKEFADKDGYVHMEVTGAIYGLSQSGGLYMNAKEAVPMRITLEELDHPQPATGGFPLEPTFFDRVRDTSRQLKFCKN